MRRKVQGPKMPRIFEELATYNAEVGRGIVHTEQWKRKMATLQDAYDQWAESTRDQAWRDKT